MPWTGHHNSGDPAHVFHGILEEHQVHHGIVVVVTSQTLLNVGEQFLVWHNVVKSISSVHSAWEVTENQVLRIVWEITVKWISWERFLQQFEHEGIIFSKVIRWNQSISVGSLGLMDPKLNHLFRLLEFWGIGKKKSLENVGQVPQVELIVEVNSSFSEGTNDILMEDQSWPDNKRSQLLNSWLESL